MLRGLAILSCALFAAGCASQTKLRQSELEELVSMLPGTWDNVAQAQEERRTGREPLEELVLAIVPIYAPWLGGHVFYLQEMAADDPRRVIDQRLLAFAVDREERIVQSPWTLEDRMRWRDGHLDPDLFKSLLPQDVRSMPGCELVWAKRDGRFEGANDPDRCRVRSHAADGQVRLEMRAELSSGELLLGTRSFDDQGRIVQGRAGEFFYRFRRRAD